MTLSAANGNAQRITQSPGLQRAEPRSRFWYARKHRQSARSRPTLPARNTPCNARLAVSRRDRRHGGARPGRQSAPKAPTGWLTAIQPKRQAMCLVRMGAIECRPVQWLATTGVRILPWNAVWPQHLIATLCHTGSVPMDPPARIATTGVASSSPGSMTVLGATSSHNSGTISIARCCIRIHLALTAGSGTHNRAARSL